MNTVDHNLKKGQTMGDTAVDGLLAGMLGGAGMALYLVLWSLLFWEGIANVLTLFDPAGGNTALTGLLAHLAVSSIYGTIFALLMRGLAWLRPSWFIPPWLAGLVYGLLLFAVAEGSLLKSVDSPLIQIAPLHFALAHGVYGLTLGYWLGRR